MRKDQRGLRLSYSGTSGKPLMTCYKEDCGWVRITAVLTRMKLWPVVALTEAELAILRMRADGRRLEYIETADRLWNNSLPIEGTLAETYLRSRGIDCELPASLRYSPGLWHSPSQAKLPAMIARLGGERGIHRTYLDAATGQKAAVESNKMMLGETDNTGVVLANNSRTTLAVGEGLKSSLSLLCGPLRERFGPLMVVSGLNAAGVGRLYLTEAEPGDKVMIACDGDEPGRKAAQKLSLHAREKGWTVYLNLSPPSQDWNDILRGAGQ